MRFISTVMAVFATSQAIKLDNQLKLEEQMRLFNECEAQQADVAANAGLDAEQMQSVVQKICNRAMGSIDSAEPELDKEILDMMKSSVAEIHATEGHPGKVLGSRSTEPDWLTNIAKGNAAQQAGIEQGLTEDRRAIADSF